MDFDIVALFAIDAKNKQVNLDVSILVSLWAASGRRWACLAGESVPAGALRLPALLPEPLGWMYFQGMGRRRLLLKLLSHRSPASALSLP